MYIDIVDILLKNQPKDIKTCKDFMNVTVQDQLRRPCFSYCRLRKPYINTRWFFLHQTEQLKKAVRLTPIYFESLCATSFHFILNVFILL